MNKSAQQSNLKELKRKNVLMVLDREFPPDVRVSNEIAILNEEGIHVDLAVYTREGRAYKEEVSDLLTVYRKPISKFTYKSSVGILKFPFYFNFWRNFLYTLVKVNNYDAIHVHDLPLAKIGKKIALEAQAKFILDLHENWPDMLCEAKHTNSILGKMLSTDAQWRTYEGRMISLADAVITVCEEMTQRLKTVNSAQKNFCVYQNVPNLEDLNNNSTKNLGDTFQLIYAGGITYPRGLQVVLEAIQLKKNKLTNFKFIIIGDGTYRTKLEEITKALKIEDLVEFKGWVSQAEVMTHLESAHLAVIPHLRSPQNDNSSPNKIYQYMLSKTAVLSSNCLSLQKIIEKTQCGWVYEDHNSEDLASKLIEAYRLKNEISTLGQTGYDAVQSVYNTKIEKVALLTLYKQLLN